MISKVLYNYRQRRKWESYIRSLRPIKDLYPALQMTDACNKQCRACLRSANADAKIISADSFDRYLDDLRVFGGKFNLRYQFVTGGEPTIWKNQGRDTVDVLASLFNLNLIETIAMPTNGKVFEDINYAREFFKRLSSQINRKIITGISIAEYQENLTEDGYIALDNLLALSKEPGMKIIPIVLVTLSVEDDIDRRIKKIYPGVIQRVTPLAPLGDASDMTDQCPSIPLQGKDKSGTGAFFPYFKNDVMHKLKISAAEFDSIENSVLMDRYSLHAHCGESPFIDGMWHYCLPFKDDSLFDLCDIGNMKRETIPGFVASHPFMNCIRDEGILSAVDEHKDQLSPETGERLESFLSGGSKVSVAYRGCMVCRALYDIGVIKELYNADCDCKR